MKTEAPPPHTARVHSKVGLGVCQAGGEMPPATETQQGKGCWEPASASPSPELLPDVVVGPGEALTLYWVL